MERAHKIEMQWHDDTNTLGSESSYTTILLYTYNEKWFYTAYTDIINYENLSVTIKSILILSFLTIITI